RESPAPLVRGFPAFRESFYGRGAMTSVPARTRSTGLRLPADYRDFVTLYGGGDLNECLGISTPPVAGSPYGGLLPVPPRKI
ncbi:SMI1/KNR4 family protein, partial [Streptomyces termitum]|uniref:SMI1/KNR4 family protein n=1 Tax=Streptomyces termitum TaxID=67368 RepID=UPI001E39F91F